MNPELQEALADWYASFNPPWSTGEVHETKRGELVETGRRFRMPSQAACQWLADVYARVLQEEESHA